LNSANHFENLEVHEETVGVQEVKTKTRLKCTIFGLSPSISGPYAFQIELSKWIGTHEPIQFITNLSRIELNFFYKF